MADDTPTPAGLVSVVAEPQPAPSAEPWWKKNLKPVQKGQVLNPDGSNGRKWREELREFFDQPADDGETVSRFHDVLLAIYKAALKGKEGAQRLIVEHMVGKAPLAVHVGGPNGEKLDSGVDAITVTLRAALAARESAAEMATQVEVKRNDPNGG